MSVLKVVHIEFKHTSPTLNQSINSTPEGEKIQVSKYYDKSTMKNIGDGKQKKVNQVTSEIIVS